MGEAEDDAVAARERLLVECQGLLRARDKLLQHLRQLSTEEAVPVETRLLAIARLTAAWETVT
jgi:hypothetical protein